MNDLLDNTKKPKNIEELYYQILEIVENLYNNNAPNNVKKIKIKKR